MRTLLSLILVSFLVACGGGGGSSPVNPTPTPTPVPTCTVDYTATYPSSYLGTHTMPTASGVLPSIWQKGIGFKDYSPYWIYGNALNKTAIHNCTADQYAQLMYTQALDKLQQDGVTFTWLYNSGPWDDASASNLTISPANYNIPEYMVQFVVTEAKKRNIDIYYIWQLWPNDVNGNTVAALESAPDNATITRIMHGWDTQAIEMAKFAQTSGIKGMMVDWNAYGLSNLADPIIHETYVTNLSATIDHVKANFSGKLFYSQGGRPWSYPRIVDKVDAIVFSFMSPHMNQADNANLSPELIQNYMNIQLNNFYSSYHCLGANTGSITCGPNGPSTKQVPMLFDLAVQSNSLYWLEGWHEDGFCDSVGPNVVTSLLSADSTPQTCVALNWSPDFSSQAIGVEGIMRTISQQTLFTVYGVGLSCSYWLSDTLVPSAQGFSDLSESIRGKPAEGIIKHWFTGN